MTARDYGNIKTHLRASARCEVAAKILTESSIGKSCCYRFSCDSGRWVDNIETEKGYTFYASESVPVDPAFR